MASSRISNSLKQFKPPTFFLIGTAGTAAGLLWWVKTKNDNPAKWHRITHRNPPETPLSSFPPLIKTGICSIRGKRDHMEDRAIVCGDLSATGAVLPTAISLFGVFDGHGGDVSSTFVGSRFPRVLGEQIQNESAEKLKDSMKDVLQRSLDATHKLLLEENKKKEPRDGTTAVVCCLAGDKLFTANVGDSRAVLSRSFFPIELSKDHKPDDPEEKKRIEKAGGMVKEDHSGCARVYYPDIGGGLAMSRALGDEFYKIPGKTLVPTTADITEYTLCEEDQFIIIASDGLWDVMSSEEAVDFVHQLRFINRNIDTAFLAQALVYEASSKNSGDNITVLVVEFEKAKKLNANLRVASESLPQTEQVAPKKE